MPRLSVKYAECGLTTRARARKGHRSGAGLFRVTCRATALILDIGGQAFIELGSPNCIKSGSYQELA